MRTLKLLATITIIIQFTSCAEANFDVKIESNSIDCFKQKDINTDTDYYIALVSYAKAKDHLILYSIKNENKTKLEILKGTFGYHHLRLGIKKKKIKKKKHQYRPLDSLVIRSSSQKTVKYFWNNEE